MNLGSLAVRLTLLGVMGCATTQGPGPAAAPSSLPPSQARSSAASPEPDPPGTRRVQGDGWTIAIPADWQERVDDRGVTLWQTLAPAGGPGHRTVSVEIAHGEESFAQLVAQLPGVYRARQAATTLREFTHKGLSAAALEVRFPAQSRPVPARVGAYVQQGRGMIVTCAGSDAEAMGPVCRDVLASVWMGATATARPPSPPAGRVWLGGRGRYVLVPAAWHAMEGASAPHGDAVGSASDGDAFATVVNFLDDIQGTPAAALERVRSNLAADTAITILRSEPAHTRTRAGHIFDTVRAQVTATASTLLQWVMPGPPGSFYTINCAGVADDVAAHPEVCQRVLESFAPQMGR